MSIDEIFAVTGGVLVLIGALLPVGALTLFGDELPMWLDEWGIPLSVAMVMAGGAVVTAALIMALVGV